MQINTVGVNRNYENKNKPAFSGIVNLPGLRPIGERVKDGAIVVGHEFVTFNEKGKLAREIPVEILQIGDSIFLLHNPEVGGIAQSMYSVEKDYTYFMFLRNLIQNVNCKVNRVTEIIGKAVMQIALKKTNGHLECRASGFGTGKSPVPAYLRLGLVPKDKTVDQIKYKLWGEKVKYENNVDMKAPPKLIEKARKELEANPMIDMRYVD